MRKDGQALLVARRPLSLARALDMTERVVMLVLYAAFVMRIAPTVTLDAGLAKLLVLPSEGMVVFFILFRRPTENVSLRPVDWLLATVAALPPLFAQPADGALGPRYLGAAILVVGTLVQLSAKVALGRSFGCVPANRGLAHGGPYRLVRHPMYAGYMLGHVGFLLMNPSAWNVAMYLVSDAIQIPRLLAEERILVQADAYRAYQGAVRWRLFPGIF